MHIDHLILRVTDAARSVDFYRQVLALTHASAPPFEVLRLSDDSVIDLLAEAPRDSAHIALGLDRPAFEAIHQRLQKLGIPFGGDPFTRDGRIGRQYGARGWTDALYFHDPDHHNIEVRTYDEH
jgi:catechol 2,3-dioxygenase-like lactoylglutathione lyase family enzyme